MITKLKKYLNDELDKCANVPITDASNHAHWYWQGINRQTLDVLRLIEKLEKNPPKEPSEGASDVAL